MKVLGFRSGGVHRYVAAAVACVAVGVSGSASAQGGVSRVVRVTPLAAPASVAQVTKVLTDEEIELLFVGFGDDIFDHERFVLARRQAIPSLWPTAGAEIVSRRVQVWIHAFVRAGGAAKTVRSSGPSTSRVSQLARETWPHARSLMSDSRANLLAESTSELTQIRNEVNRGSYESWFAAISRYCKRLEGRLVSSVANQVLQSSKSPAASMQKPTAPVVVTGRPAVVPGKSARPSSRAPSLAGAVAESGETTPAASTTALASIALSKLPARRAVPWTGDLRYVSPDWTSVITSLRNDPSLKDELAWIISEAERVTAIGPAMFRRAMAIQEIPPEHLVTGLDAMGANAERRALAYFDCTQSHFLLKNGVTLALAARATNRPEFLQRCIEILGETSTKSPLQRPGYTLKSPADTLPVGGDGVWLGTAMGIRGVIDMLDILGANVPGDLRASLRALLRREVHRIVDDWSCARPWYVKTNAANSNQWIEPSSALLLACQYLEDANLRPAYDLAVENILATIAIVGSDGAWREGVSYGVCSMDALFAALSAMSRGGDHRFDYLPYRLNAWRWLLHMHLPGGNLVNWGDSTFSRLPSWHVSTPFNSLARAAELGGGDAALAQLKSLFPNGSDMGPGVWYATRVSGLPAAPLSALDTFSYFPDAQLVTWRSQWNPPSVVDGETLSIWVKGSSPEEIHAHRDQGQVSVYRGSEPILLDCGLSNYGDPEYSTHFAAAAGHGIMQVGALPPSGRGVDAPLEVHALNAAGGDVSVDVTRGYAGALECSRRVRWSRSGVVDVLDRATFSRPVSRGSELFRFHTGSRAALVVSGSGNSWSVSWHGAELTLNADAPIDVEQQLLPDAATDMRMHQAIIIKARGEVSAVQLQSYLKVNLSRGSLLSRDR